ncbi:MAG: glycosyltransferase [Acidobacteria bacterium]|nr:glycosyltransferase [Acidobacteriota bacterium]
MQNPLALASSYMSRVLWSRSNSGVVGRNVILMVASSLGVMFLNGMFLALGARVLGPVEFGKLAMALAVLNLALAPLGAIQVWSSRSTLGPREVLRSSMGHRMLAGSVVVGLALIASRAVLPYWRLSHYSIVVLLAVWFPLATLGALVEGARLTQGFYRGIANAHFWGNGFVRLLVGVMAMGLGWGAVGALVAVVAGQCITLISLWRRTNRPSPAPLELLLGSDNQSRQLGSRVLLLFGTGALLSVDTLVARHVLSGGSAGRYSVAAILADVAFVVPVSLTFLLHPHLTRFSLSSNQVRLDFTSGLKKLAVASLAIGAPIMLLAEPLLSLLFGSTYSGAANVVRLLVVQAMVLAVAQLMVTLQISRGSRTALAPWVAAIGVFVATETMTMTPLRLATVMVMASVAVILIMTPSTFTGLTTAVSRGRGELLDMVVLPEAEVDLTLVVPFYNPGATLQVHVAQCVDVLNVLGVTYEILAVSDGSTDGSGEALEESGLPHVRVITLPVNQGKGSALRTGLTEGHGRYLGFIDADGDLPAELLTHFAAAIRDANPDIVYGSKLHPHSKVVYPPLRRAYSHGYQSLVRLLFQLPVRDTQTGIKIIRREALEAALPRMVEKKFAFDLELFVVCQKLGYDRFLELPVTIRERLTSTVSRRSATEMLLDTFAIFYRLRVLKYYDRKLKSHNDRTVTRAFVEVPHGELLHRRDPHFRPLRILILNWRDLAHPGAGGAEVYTQAVAEELVKMGHSVTIFCAAVVGELAREDVNGVAIVRRGSRYGVYRAARQFYRSEGRGQFDVVVDEINTRPFNAVKWVEDAHVVGLAHQVCRELWSLEMPWPVSWIGRHVLEPLWLRRYKSTPVITVSRSSEESLREYGLSNIVTIPNGKPSSLRRLNLTKEQVPTVLFMGRLEKHKRPLDALRAFEAFREDHPDARMWIIGSGSMERRMREVASPNVTFFGHVSDAERNDLISRSHVLLVTSIREGWGLVVTEAALLGTLAIGYDVPGLRDSVAAAGGYLCDPHPESMARVMRATFEDWSSAEGLDDTSAGVIPWSEVAQLMIEHGAITRSWQQSPFHS